MRALPAHPTEQAPPAPLGDRSAPSRRAAVRRFLARPPSEGAAASDSHAAPGAPGDAGRCHDRCHVVSGERIGLAPAPPRRLAGEALQNAADAIITGRIGGARVDVAGRGSCARRQRRLCDDRNMTPRKLCWLLTLVLLVVLAAVAAPALPSCVPNCYNADLGRADLGGADLSGADLRLANLVGAWLRGANLSNADLSAADLYGADLRGADLRGANLEHADLYSNFGAADLRGASLAFANLSGAYLYAAALAGGIPGRCRPEQRGSERRYLGRCNPQDRRPERCDSGRRRLGRRVIVPCRPIQRGPDRSRPDRSQSDGSDPDGCGPEWRGPDRGQSCSTRTCVTPTCKART